MAETATLSATFSVVFNRCTPILEKCVREEVGVLCNQDGEAQKLSSNFKKIQESLMDAERKAVTDRKVKSWLDKLRDISYDIDAVLEEWDLPNLRRELDDASESSDSLRQKVRSFLQSVNLREKAERLTTARKMKKINKRLDSLAQENENEFKFIPNLSPESQDFTRNMSTSITEVKVSELHGRKDDLQSLMNKLLGDHAIQIVSLVGAGGIGKTTLAQHTFHHVKVKSHFNERIWVCVSYPFEWIKIGKAILEALKQSSSSLSQFDEVLQRVKESIKGKRLLLVLDDVWAEYDDTWKTLIASLSEAPGSRILLTTRNKKVTELMPNNQVQQLDPLSDRDCWLVLEQIAFKGKDDGDHAMLKETGFKIALKCKGLPLAAKILGGLLSSKRSLREWENVLNSDLWALEKVRKELFPVLALSYNELDPVWKRCLSYCAIFPKDSLIDVEELIRSWMAHGFISSSETGDEMETNGRSFFNNLANRCFFQDFTLHPYMDNHIIFCKMHDIIHDFVRDTTKNECLIVEKIDEEEEKRNKNRIRHPGNEAKKPRHLSIQGNEAKNLKIIISNRQRKKLCSVLCPHNEIPPDFLSRLKRVRWLRLHDCNLLNIPSEIGDLIHIRYLDLSSNTSLKEIPESICRLYYLQALNTKHCSSLSELPRGFNKLKNLRHLLVYGTGEKFFIQGIEKLHNLRELDYFTYNSGSSNKLGHLKDLNKIRGSLHICISDLDDAHDHLEESKGAELKKKIDIEHLSLEFGSGDVTKEIIEALEPSSNLRCLDFIGHHLPNWITNLNNLRKLFISGGRNGIEVLDSLGSLSFLEELNLVGIKLERLSLEFFGLHTTTSAKTHFPKLKKLYIHCCRWLKEWEDIGGEDGDMINISALPRLQILQLQSIPELEVLPHRLLRMASSLQELDLRDCRYLQERYREETGEDRNKISQIPNVRLHQADSKN